jgi:hypothetical protein
VSFLLNQTGHLDPSQGPSQLGVSCFDYKCFENKREEEESMIAKAKQQERQITHGSLSLKSLNTNDHLSQLWNLERLEALIVSLNGILALVLNVEDWSAWVY